MRSSYVVDAALLLRRTYRNAKFARHVCWLALAGGMAACSDIPPAYNPIEWGQSAMRWIGGDSGGAPSAAVVEPPPAEGRPYPNLAMVPKPPPRDTIATRTARQRELAALRAERETAEAADTALRQGKAPPPTVPTAPVATVGDAMPAAPPPPVALPPPEAAMSAPPPSEATTTAVQAPSPAVSAPQTAAAVAPSAPVLTTSERRGTISFGRGARSPLSDSAQRTLQDAAALALAHAGRVRLVPAEYGRDAVLPQEAQERANAIRQILVRAGLPAERIAVAENQAQRVDVYDVYVDY